MILSVIGKYAASPVGVTAILNEQDKRRSRRRDPKKFVIRPLGEDLGSVRIPCCLITSACFAVLCAFALSIWDLLLNPQYSAQRRKEPQNMRRAEDEEIIHAVRLHKIILVNQ
jgi:hypothetical protein